MAESLGAFEQAVLLALLRLGDDACGRAIMKKFRIVFEREVAASAEHATRERLQRKALIDLRALRSGRRARNIRHQISDPGH